MNTNNNSIELMIKSLESLKLAFSEANKAWSNCSTMDELNSPKYPFTDSFDELNLKVQNWTNASIKELNSKRNISKV